MVYQPVSPSFSVIIPALNEAPGIANTVRAVYELDPLVEVIVADGGSRDGTVEAARQAGAEVVAAPRGRGPQLNAGAACAQGDILVFLHADTRLPAAAFQLLADYMDNPAVQAGTFRLTFDERHWLFAIYTYFSRFDSVLTSFGDQCIVVRRALFEELGGFPPWPLFEDVAFLQAVRRRTKIYSFPAAIVTSARRFRQGGVLRQSLRNGWYVLQYLLGASPEELARRYRGGAKGRPARPAEEP